LNWLRGRSHFILASTLLGLIMVLFLIVPLAASIGGSTGGAWAIIPNWAEAEEWIPD